MKRWLTIFPELRNEHINKDVGLIPIILEDYYDYKSSILTVNSDYTVDLQSCDVINLPSNGSNKITIMKYLLKNGKKWDVINTYHFSLTESLLWFLTYKIVNPYGKVYLKMDLSTKYMYDYTDNKIMLALRRLCLKFIDLISVESSIVQQHINKYYKNRVKLIPNGFYWDNPATVECKRNDEFLYVGRLGAECKSTELLVEAFEKTINTHDWKLRLVGPMERTFKHFIDNKFHNNLDLKKRIVCEGPVFVRQQLSTIYLNAKVLILCSEYESFGIVLTEALSMGCYLIGTEGINSIRDIVENDRIGIVSKTNNVEDLKEKIIAIAKNKYVFCQDNVDYRASYAEKKYSWINICKDINQELWEKDI